MKRVQGKHAYTITEAAKELAITRCCLSTLAWLAASDCLFALDFTLIAGHPPDRIIPDDNALTINF